jgi:hypothetical protein
MNHGESLKVIIPVILFSLSGEIVAEFYVQKERKVTSCNICVIWVDLSNKPWTQQAVKTRDKFCKEQHEWNMYLSFNWFFHILLYCSKCSAC